MYNSPNQGAQPLPEEDPSVAVEMAASQKKPNAGASATGKKAYSSRKERDFNDDQSEDEDANKNVITVDNRATYKNT